MTNNILKSAAVSFLRAVFPGKTALRKETEDEKNTVNERRSEDEKTTYVNGASTFFAI
ncbi:hypothetical protein [Bilifractor sp. HCP3S3_D3]|uniref:hypothetical protein n=1 Tax=Bilifractor sp. HCP3S3_D3 TaxID=3438907 RepID=UPI003F8BBC1F